MADQDYNNKLESLQRYIPFLLNMMGELKAKGNREAQLNKIQSLHDMITNTKKKLKIETLNRCEEVLNNIYFKVNPQMREKAVNPAGQLDFERNLPGIESPRYTPQSPSPPRNLSPTKPITIPTEKIHPRITYPGSSSSSRPKIEVYSKVVINPSSKPKSPVISTKIPDMSKPPISLDDLKTLEDDVQQKITDSEFVTQSVDQLQEVKKHLQLQLRLEQMHEAEDSKSDTTLTNPTNPKQNFEHKSVNKIFKKEIKSGNKDEKEEKKRRDSSSGKSENKETKETDVFGNLLCSIDDKLIEDKKKSKEIRMSKEGNSLHLEKDDTKDKKSKKSSKDKDKSRSSSHDRDKKKDKYRDKSKSRSEKRDSKKKKKDEDEKKDEQQKIKEKEKREEREKRVEEITNNVMKPLDQKIASTIDNKINNFLKSFANPSAWTESNKDSIESVESTTSNSSDARIIPEKPEPITVPSDIAVSSDPQLVPSFRRLADKYNPKPKSKPSISSEPEVDRSVSESIENFMKTSPTKLLSSTLLSQVKLTSTENLTEPPVPPVPPVIPPKQVQLPEILQRFFSKPLLGDIIPKHVTDPIVKPNTDSRNTVTNVPVTNRLSTIHPLTKPGAIIPPEPPVLSPPHKSVQFQPPRFISPPRIPEFLSPDVIRRPLNHNTNPSMLGPGPGMLPSPNCGLVPPPPSFNGFTDHAMNMGYGTPRVDFDTPTTPRVDFDSPPLHFEPNLYPNNDQFGMNQRFLHPDQQMMGNFAGPSHFSAGMEVNHFNHSYDMNRLPYHPQLGEIPHYNMPNQGFYRPERPRWSRDNRRPGDPRSYKEYKEIKEQQERDAKVAQEAQRQLEIKDPRLASREGNSDAICRDPRLSRDPCLDSSNNDQTEVMKDPRLSRGREKSIERTLGGDSRDRARSSEITDTIHEIDRTRSKSREPHRARSRERESRDPRSRRSDGKLDTSKFDKMYSRTNRGRSRSRSQEKEADEDETFMSPLDSLYNADKGRTGRGYGFQNFKIPRKAKVDDPKKPVKVQKECDRRQPTASRRNRISSSSSEECDTVYANDSMLISDDEDQEPAANPDKEVKDQELTSNLAKEAKEKIDMSRIRVVISNETNIWGSYADLKSPTEADFVSEYDLEFQRELENSESKIKTDDETNNITERPKSSEIEDTIEEPSSSSQDVEADSSKKVGETTAQIKVDSKSADSKTLPAEPEPSEQKILAHFFENLLKSSNKKDKKTALFSLIQTFSDTFDDKEIKKIQKIIKVNEDVVENSDDEKESIVAENTEQSLEETTNIEAQDQQPVVGSTTEEDSVLVKSLKSTDNILPTESVVKETQVNEVTKSTDMTETPIEVRPETTDPEKESFINEQHVVQSDDSLKFEDKEVAQSDELSDATALFQDEPNPLEPIMVSVGERIKNRKRAPISKPKKHKTELDYLHEDIKDMFIRDGVLTATGKRMCRILKDDPNVLKSSNPETPPATPVPVDKPAEKKIRKKPGPKPKPKVSKELLSKELDGNTMKDMRVVISKIPDNALVLSSSLRSQKIRGTRDLIEVEDEENQDSTLELSFSDSSEEDSELESAAHTESEDDENEQTKLVKGKLKPKRKKAKRRRGGKWASGVITKLKKKKPKENVLKDKSPERPVSAAQSKVSEATEVSENDSLSEIDESDKLVEPDKEYYYDFVNKRKLTCKLCNYSGHMMTGHYLREHPQSEVLCARFSPEVASAAIKDFAESGKKYESIVIPKVSAKYHYTCRMCTYQSFVSPIFFYEHVTTHTGEWRHQCGICEFFAATGKTMAAHFQTVHPGEERKAIRRTYTLGIIFAYVCGECNFVQLKEKNVEDHANIFHLGEQPSIYKVTMSLDLDPELDKLADISKALESSQSEVPKRKKPGPKSKTMKPVPENHDASLEENCEISPAPSVKKRPGPKSKTISVQKEPIDEPPLPSPTPVRRKPGPKPKIKSVKIKQTKVPDDTSTDEESVRPKTRRSIYRKSESETIESDSPIKQTPLKKRTRDLANLLNEDSGDDLDTIITLSSRSSRAAKEKATEKLKTLMESNEGMGKRRSEADTPNKRPNTDTTPPEKQVEPSSATQVTPSEERVKPSGATEVTPPEERVEPSGATDVAPPEEQVEPTTATEVDSQSPAQIEPTEKSNDEEKEEAIEKFAPRVGEMDPPTMNDQSHPKENNLSAFTSKNDFSQEARIIEEDRLRKMEELNKSIGSRAPKLDFVNKLSTRLNNEQDELINEQLSEEQITVKDEPEDRESSNITQPPSSEQLEKQAEPIIKVSPLTKDTSVSVPIASPPILSKKPLLEAVPAVKQSNIVFPQNKSNSLFSNMIEKLQGKLSAASKHKDDNSSPIQSPVGKTLNDGLSSTSVSEPFVLVGDLVKATKNGQEIVYSCHVKGCYVATKDTTVFQLHCKFGHKDLTLASSLCNKCQVEISTTPDTTLLENLYDHLIFAHSDFLSKPALRMRRLSGDKLSIKKENENKKSTTETNETSEDFEDSIDKHIVTAGPSGVTLVPAGHMMGYKQVNPAGMETDTAAEEPIASEANLQLAEDFSFSFKVSDVMSLADSSGSSKAVVKTEPKLPSLKLAPQLTALPGASASKKLQTPMQEIVIKEVQMSNSECKKGKKAPKSLQKLLESPGDLYKCPHYFCSFSSSNCELLRRHMHAHKLEPNSLVACVYCDIKTPWEHVPMHIDIRHSACKYSCASCLYRAVLKEYVYLHIEKAHPDSEFTAVALPQSRGSKFSITEENGDHRALCQPYQCTCVSSYSTETNNSNTSYLFENEFMKHLEKYHNDVVIACGYPGCQINAPSGNVIINHWANAHGVATYQCGICKHCSQDLNNLYLHFANRHPCNMPSILVRKNYFLPKNREVGYSNEAFRNLVRLVKLPDNLSVLIGKRNQKTIKLVAKKGPENAEDSQNKPEAQNSVGTKKGISSATSLILSPGKRGSTSPKQKKPMVVLPSSNLTLLVTTTNNDNILLVPALVSPKPGQVLTSTAPINKVPVQTSTASEKILRTALPPKPFKFGNITIYPSDNSGVVLPPSGSILTTVPSSSSLPSSASVADKPSENTTVSAKDTSTFVNKENSISEEDLLQSAIQSILDHEEEVGPNTVNQNVQPERQDVSSPPPLAPISNSGPSTPTTSDTRVQTKRTPNLKPLEHIEVVEKTRGNLGNNKEAVDPLNLECEDDFNLLIDNDAIDPLSDDILNIEPTLTPDLSLVEDSSNATDKNVAVESNLLPPPSPSPGEKALTEPRQDPNKGPLKITQMNRSVSVISNSDDDSDSSNLDKKKRGLLGYQLFRCAACDLSFSSLRPFKSHMMTVCKKAGPKCCHCDRVLKNVPRLCDHIMSHGVPRFSCSLCNEKFHVVNLAKLHMKNRHSINQINLVPVNLERNDIDNDTFMLKPCQAITPVAKEKDNSSESPKATADENSFTPDQIETLPTRQIFSTNVKCGLCNYQTKVRVNIIRHLQMHLDEKAVSDIAPVNPVPCLEKNEKMFDKMMNFAASSVTTSPRMGEGGKEKEEETFPEFVPSHRRFVCCAQGCSYLCLEEGNLKHHIMALHSDESDFTCAHCKIKIEPTEIDNVIKHFKFHSLHLYKCQYCSFVHYLKHKVEGHISNSHLDAVVKLVTLRSMDAEPQDQEDGVSGPATPQSITLSKFKPWNCCMCKAKYYTKEDIETHAIKKHNIDAQFKCTLCAFKSDTEVACRGHFMEQHPGHEFDIIFVYQKLEEEPVKEVEVNFDTTPLWQRDKPRVRHIRGILFDESSPQPSKSPKKRNTAASNSKGPSTSKAGLSGSTTRAGLSSTATITSEVEAAASSSGESTVPGSTTRKNFFDCIDAVARGASSLNETPDPSNQKASTKSIPQSVDSKSEVIPSPSIQKDSGKSTSRSIVAENKESNVVTLGPSNRKEPRKSKPVIQAENAVSECEKPMKLDGDSTILLDPTDDDVVLVPPTSPNVIVIESDEEEPTVKKSPKKDDSPKIKEDNKLSPEMKNRNSKRPGTTDLLHEAVKFAKIEEPDDEDAIMAQSCSRQNLLNLYGSLGSPLNKQWKCPKCNQFKSKRVSDFMFHLYKDHKTYRFRCKACTDLSITYKYMLAHIDLHPGFTDDIIERLSPNVKLDTWIHMVIREQSLEILKNAPLFKKRPITAPTDIKCYFCEEKFMLWPDCWEHMLYHWVMMPYQCQDCPSEFYTVFELRQHCKTVHFKTSCQEAAKGPTLAKAIQFTENINKRLLSQSSSPNLPKRPRLEEDSEGSNQVVQSSSKPSENAANQIILLDDDEEEPVKPTSNEAFACRICAFMSDIEDETVEHMKTAHATQNPKDVSRYRYQVLEMSKCESPETEPMACNICNIVLSEIKLRRHFMAMHPKACFLPYKYRCDFCDYKFSSVGSAKNHYSRVHAIIRTSFISVAAARDKTKNPIIYKHYFCTKCSYSVISNKSMSVKIHLKTHYKNTLKQAESHPEDLNEAIARVNVNIAQDLKLICSAAKIVKSCWETENKTCESEDTSALVHPLKQMAKKSTSTPHLKHPRAGIQEVEEGYSYYGVPQKTLDLSQVETTFEMDDLEYTTTAEQMMKMVNMDPFVDMSDCMVDIMPIDFI